MKTNSSKSNSNIFGTLLITLTTLLLSGCAPLTYRNDFNEYGDVYADSQNHQMLLNLARLSQHAPPYFFQSGNIQQNYTFTGSASAQLSQSQGANKIQPYGWFWNMINFSGQRTSQPTFNFVPLVGGEFAAHLITPIRPDMFDAFFEANYPVDILMRSLVQQVQFTIGTNSLILNNIPSKQNAENYARFLRLCDMLRDLQDRGDLLLVSRHTGTNFEQIAEFTTNTFKASPDPQMMINTTSQGYHWSTTNGGWRVEREVPATNTLSFQLTDDGVKFLQDQIKQSPLPAPYNHPDQVENLIEILKPTSKIPAARVTLRSFLFTLQEMATEQEAFRLLETNQEFPAQDIPVRQLRPVLQIAWNSDREDVIDPVISLYYKSKRYEITDPTHPQYESGGYNSYNRDAFLLACTLFSQISLDPTTLNYQQQYLLTR